MRGSETSVCQETSDEEQRTQAACCNDPHGTMWRDRRDNNWFEDVNKRPDRSVGAPQGAKQNASPLYVNGSMSAHPPLHTPARHFISPPSIKHKYIYKGSGRIRSVSPSATTHNPNHPVNKTRLRSLGGRAGLRALTAACFVFPASQLPSDNEAILHHKLTASRLARSPTLRAAC